MSKLKGATGLLLATLMVSCSGGGLIPATAVKAGEEITITVELPYPKDVDIHIGIPGVTVTCTVGCEGKQTEVTDDQGVVTFTGNTPLTVRAEKTGYLPAERVVSDGSLVAMGHEWPPEAESVIRQLGLADAIASDVSSGGTPSSWMLLSRQQAERASERCSLAQSSSSSSSWAEGT